MTRLTLPKAVIFDWDNTLVDSWPSIHAAINVTMQRMGHDLWSLDETKARVALSMRDAFPSWFGDRWQEASAIFTEAFGQIHLDHLQALPQAETMLQGLTDLGLSLFVVSNKRSAFLLKEAQALGWMRYFTRLVGAGEAARDKPDPAPVALALEKTHLQAGEDVWFVGDSIVDVQCAVNSGCVPVLIGEPLAPSDDLDFYAPRHHIKGCGDLLGIIQQRPISIPSL